MDKLAQLAKKVGTKAPQRQPPPNRGNDNDRGNKKFTPNGSNKSSNQSTPAKKEPESKETEMEKFMRKRLYKALFKHKRDKRIRMEKAKSMNERINQQSKDAKLKTKGMFDDWSTSDDSSSSVEDMEAVKYLKVPIDKKKDDMSQLQTHEFDEKDKAQETGDFFYSLNKKIKFDYCSFMTSKMKPDILGNSGFLKGIDYTFDFLKSGPKAQQVLEVRAFYDSDEDKYYEHINDYVHDQLIKHLPNKKYRYYTEDIFTSTLLCDLCHKLGHTMNTWKLKTDTWVLWGSIKHHAQQWYLKCWFFWKEMNHVYSRCPDVQSRRYTITPMDKWDKCQIFGHTTDRWFIKVLRNRNKLKYKSKIYCYMCEEQCSGAWNKKIDPKFVDYDDDFYHHRFSLGSELQWVVDTKDIHSKTQRNEYDYAGMETNKLKEERKQWFVNYAARLQELEDQKLHNHLMDFMEKTDIDYKRAMTETHWDENVDFMQVDGKLINNKKKSKKGVDEKYEHALDLELSYDHIHGGAIVESTNVQDPQDEAISIENEDERLKAIKEKWETDYKNELMGIDARIEAQRQLDIKTMLRHSKRADNKRIMKSGAFSREHKQPNAEERFAEGREYLSENSDDDIGYIGYVEKSFETKIKTDFMRKLSKELVDLIKDEVNKDIGEYQFINRDKDNINPFEAFFKKRDRPGLFDSQPSALDETSSQDGSVWSNDYGKKSVFTITSKSPSSKLDTTPSDILMRSDHSKNSEKSGMKKSKVKFFDLEDSECSQI